MMNPINPCAKNQANPDVAKATQVYEALRRTRPATRADLRNYVKVFLDVDVPDRRICPNHSSPMDYLWNSFAMDYGLLMKDDWATQGCAGLPSNSPSSTPNHQSPIIHHQCADSLVWANRAGGKTELAAVATLLDAIFKPNCQIRILGGSGEQSSRMYEYLVAFLRRGFEPFLAGPMLKGKSRFANGSTVEVLTQSPTSVRGTHVQKLRCDEVELFDEDVFAAAKFTTLSTDDCIGSMELISTMHKPYGIMQREVAAAMETRVPVFKWCLWETIERCVGRECSQCPLWCDCGGRAKGACGYLKIDDCIAQMRRSSRSAWESEMLCIRPSMENVIFSEFDPATHVRPVDYDPNLPLYRTLDFGFVNPFVCLWVQVDHEGVVRVIDEYVRSRATIDVHAKELKARTPCAEEQVAATFCDPAGAGASDITGTSVTRELRTLGIVTKHRASGILEGIELIRRAIRAGDGSTALVISPRCVRLIEAMQCYHYPDTAGSNAQRRCGAAAGELPFKDGVYDHPIDALRYFFIHVKRTTQTASRRY